MKIYTSEELREVLRLHKLWLEDKPGGVRADLSYADLYGANLRSADLRRADLYGAYLYNADLYGANLSGADLTGADLRGANITNTNFNGTMYENDIPVIINTEYYSIVKCKQYIQIGCEVHTPKEWSEFTDKEIAAMDDNAAKFWSKYKDLIVK